MQHQNNYFYEAGAVQQYTKDGPERIIESEYSAIDAKKIPQDLAIKIVHALNFFDTGYVPSADDLDEVEKHAKWMEDHCVYGGGIILGMVHDCRRFNELKEQYDKKQI